MIISLIFGLIAGKDIIPTGWRSGFYANIFYNNLGNFDFVNFTFSQVNHVYTFSYIKMIVENEY